MKNIWDHYADMIISSLLFVILLSLYVFYVPNLNYHADEYEWVGRSYFLDLILTRDMDNLLWDSHFSYDHPKLTYYLFGAVLYPDFLMSGSPTYIDFLGKYNIFQTDYRKIPEWKIVQAEFNKVNFGYMNREDCRASYCQSLYLIQKVRLLNIFFLAFSGILVYSIARLLSGKFVSIIITLYWGTHIIIILWGLSAMGESIFLFFFNLGLFLIFLLLGSEKYSLADMTILGCITALSFSAKIHGAFLFITAAVFLLVRLLKLKLTKKIHSYELVVKPILWMTFVFIFITVLINPYLWLNPVGKTRKMIEHRYTSAQKQQAAFPVDALYTPQQRITRIYNHLYVNPEDSQFVHFIRTRLLLIFTGLGIYSLLKDKGKNPVGRYFIVYSLVITLFMSWFLLLDWQRYYNILVLPYSVLLFKGISFLFQYVPSAYILLKKYIRTKMTV